MSLLHTLITFLTYLLTYLFRECGWSIGSASACIVCYCIVCDFACSRYSQWVHKINSSDCWLRQNCSWWRTSTKI